MPGDQDRAPGDPAELDAEAPEDDEEHPDPDQAREPLLAPRRPDQTEEKRKAEWKKIPLRVRQAVEKLHNRMGHFSGTAMHRAMKDARCSKIALRAAKLYRCPACAS